MISPAQYLLNVSLITVCFQSVLYGMCVVLFSTSTYLHLLRHCRWLKGPTSRKLIPVEGTTWTLIFIGTILIFICSTAVWITLVFRLVQAFYLYKGGAAPVEFLADFSQTSNIVRTTFDLGTVIIGDAMITYRLWVVWNYNRRVIIFPCLSIVALITCTIGIITEFTQWNPEWDIFSSAAGRWIISDLCFTFCTNTYSTAMISYRIWKINRLVKQYGGGSLTSVMATMIESAAVYSTWSLLFLIVYTCHSTLQFFMVDTIGHVCAATALLINVRVGLGWAQTSVDPTTLVSQLTATTAQEEHELRVGVEHVHVVGYPNEDSESVEPGNRSTKSMTR
ncbi:hypothetical protein BDZ89DRAFT_1140033 [Hymenopellis radicata]|nr:hypothetical protein BDZ89DRAFT_1140033 [Hymenopellis radicata]